MAGREPITSFELHKEAQRRIKAKKGRYGTFGQAEDEVLREHHEEALRAHREDIFNRIRGALKSGAAARQREHTPAAGKGDTRELIKHHLERLGELRFEHPQLFDEFRVPIRRLMPRGAAPRVEEKEISPAAAGLFLKLLEDNLELRGRKPPKG